MALLLMLVCPDRATGILPIVGVVRLQNREIPLGSSGRLPNGTLESSCQLL